MKGLSYFLLVIFLTAISACGQKGRSKENNNAGVTSESDTIVKKTTLKFIATEHDFGQVKEGEKVSHVFEVQNTGKADLFIQSVKPSCGCTTPKYEQKPIRPGKKGTIEVVFNTKGRPGKQRKSIMVVTNTEPPNTVLFFNCEVTPAEETVKQ
jgi:hypothetical protein